MSWVLQVCSFFSILLRLLPVYCTLNGVHGEQEYAEFRRSFLPKTSDKGGQNTKHQRSEGENIFRAIWNVPNYCQDRFGIELPLSDYGIEFNKDNSRWAGDILTVFNHDSIGYFPYIDDQGRFINGGIPQLGNITDHLERAAENIEQQIPDPNYQGLGMIDWEPWQPQWHIIDSRYPLYRKSSIDHVRSRHPEWDNATVTTVAALEWTKGARLFMESTIQLAKQLRPEALWGYYHYPYCDIRDQSNTCRSDQPKENDEITWLFNETTILSPSIYLRPTKELDFEAAVRSQLTEAFRIKAESSDPKGVVMSYIRFNYTETEFYLSLEDLNHTILTSAEFGTHGVVFWGDNYDDKTAQTCMELRKYIIHALGPTVVMAREGAESCSKRVCSGRGRCVGDILTCGGGGQWQNEMKTHRKKQKGSMCSCRCFVGWEGGDCSIVSKH